jgi:hypothetical protein
MTVRFGSLAPLTFFVKTSDRSNAEKYAISFSNNDKPSIVVGKNTSSGPGQSSFSVKYMPMPMLEQKDHLTTTQQSALREAAVRQITLESNVSGTKRIFDSHSVDHPLTVGGRLDHNVLSSASLRGKHANETYIEAAVLWERMRSAQEEQFQLIG